MSRWVEQGDLHQVVESRTAHTPTSWGEPHGGDATACRRPGCICTEGSGVAAAYRMSTRTGTPHPPSAGARAGR
jgi:hypothetical protein